jgi:hypothetical protein
VSASSDTGPTAWGMSDTYGPYLEGLLQISARKGWLLQISARKGWLLQISARKGWLLQISARKGWLLQIRSLPGGAAVLGSSGHRGGR